MLESCQVLVTGNVPFVLLKRSQCPLLLSVARKAAGATGRVGWGKCDLHRAVIAGITELQKPSGENWSLLTVLWCFISLVCSTRWCLCLCMTCGTLAQASEQLQPRVHCAQAAGLCSFTTFRIQAAGRGEWGFPLATSASSSASCFQRGRMKHEFLLFNDLLLDILRYRR